MLEAGVENTAAVGEAVASLVARGAQAIWSPGDVTVLTAIDSAVAQARAGRIPMFTNIPGSSEQGTLFDVGANYLEVGRQAGLLAGRVLSGEDPATIPVENLVPERVTINEAALDGLRDPWRFTEALLRQARADSGATRSRPPPGRRFQIDLLEYVEVQDVEDAERGIRDGFRDAGWVDGRDFVIRKRIAQGDMPTLPALVDAAITEGTDLIMTLSTPTLQAALARGRDTPIIFTFCASGVAAGAGTSNDDHLPNVTGVPSASPYTELVELAREAMPGLRRVGTLVVPSEANSVFNTAQLVEEAGRYGIEVEQMAVNAVTEVSDAAIALCGRDIDAILQVGSNLTTSSFVTVAKAARDARVPLWSVLTGDLEKGAAVVMARDYEDAGHQAAGLAVRVLEGESPATIPFQPLTTSRLLVNLDAARAQGFRVPAAIVDRAEVVIGEP